MAIRQPTRDGAGESMAEFAQRRNREEAARGLARAIGRQDYGRAIRAGQDLALKTPNDVAAHGAVAQSGDTPEPDYPIGVPNFGEVAPMRVSHPGSLESLIPIWGSGRETIADFQDGDYFGAALNGGLTVLDASLAGSIGKAVAKGGLYAIEGAARKTVAQQKWKAVRRTLGDLGVLEPYQHGHHWLLPQNWGKDVPAWIKNHPIPDWIKNHPLNIQGMPSPEVHGRLHGPYKGLPRDGRLERYQHGTPTWSKVATGSAIGHPVAAATNKRAEDR